ncbi:hypothetical protein ACFFF5_18820 [Lederbergia wuyishanensis]|uniref:Transmembrane protein n=1 Tax=Lederbergia wuyishanensis TaxID=1347903 RepID=A0ABU0D5K7_9BACI|nr:hypothetical protein [Lederbergia wuyishanensis]MCJ8009835.1 hypothetical protein [Lederbergia wuyishanensis]MDQ0343692.1 hypothetical protein [Lederbergia wuyishanensis]
MHPIMRHRGRRVEIRDCHGRVHRGVVDGFSSGGVFLRSAFSVVFIPFFAIVFFFPF